MGQGAGLATGATIVIDKRAHVGHLIFLLVPTFR